MADPSQNVKFSLRKSLAGIPGPKGLPLIGTAYEYIIEKDGISFKKMFEVYSKRASQYGPIYKEKIGPITNVVISDICEYRKVMQRDGKMPARLPIEPLKCYRQSRGLGEGLASANGSEWLRHRTAVNRKLLRPREVTLFAPAMNSAADDFIFHLSKGLNGDGEYMFSLEDLLFKWALESVGTVLLGSRIGALDDASVIGQAFVVNLRGVFDGLQTLMFGLPIYKVISTESWRSFSCHCDAVFNMGASILAARSVKDDGSEGDESLLGYLMSCQELSQSEVEGLVIELMVGSVETVANTVLWCLYLMSTSDCGIQEKLYEEVSRFIQPGQDISLDSASQTPYLKACVKETLRLYSPAFTTSRYTEEDMELCGHTVPAGTHVQANTYHMNRSADIFDRPEKFDPDRWISRPTPDAATAAQLVWGHGARMCIGRRIAEQEMYIILAKLVKKYRFEYTGKEEPKPIMKLVLNPDIPMTMKFVSRT